MNKFGLKPHHIVEIVKSLAIIATSIATIVTASKNKYKNEKDDRDKEK